MALTILKRGAKALFFNTPRGKTRAVETTLAKWRRKEGPASFIADLITLRKTLMLCYHCAKYRLPRNWTRLFDYEELTIYHGEGACDYCREDNSMSLFIAGEGDYWKAYEQGRRHEEEVRARQRAMFNKDKRFLIGV
jgi:hypothetical protein